MVDEIVDDEEWRPQELRAGDSDRATSAHRVLDAVPTCDEHATGREERGAEKVVARPWVVREERQREMGEHRVDRHGTRT